MSRSDRDVVLLTVDSLRADHCRAATGRHALAPTLARLADEGVRYDRAVAPGPRTPSAMPTLFTGEHVPPVDGADGDYWERRRTNIRRHLRRYRTVAERFRERGYATLGVTVNPWTHGTGFDRGFDSFVEVNGTTLGDFGPPAFRAVDRLLRGSAVGERLYWFNKREWFVRWRDFYDRVQAALDGVDRPYFLWVFLLDTHQPYVVARTDRAESSAVGMYYAALRELRSDRDAVPDWVAALLRRAYRDAVRAVDRFTERLLADAPRPDPALVVHADHGEAFGEHGTFGHEQQLFEENVHVPLVVANAGVRARVTDPLPLRRLPAMLTGLTEPGDFEPNRYTAPYAVSATDDGSAHAVVGRSWKYVRGADGAALYDLDADAGERTDVIAARPDVAARMGAALRRHHGHRTERQAIADGVAREVARL